MIDSKVLSRIRRLTALNNHGAAYAQGAAALGLPELQAKFESVNAEHERQGYLSVELSYKRQRLYAELIDAAKFQLAPALYRQFYMCF